MQSDLCMLWDPYSALGLSWYLGSRHFTQSLLCWKKAFGTSTCGVGGAELPH